MTSKRGGYVRWAVVRQGRSLLDASYTPEYFLDRQRRDAEAWAHRINGWVVDLFRKEEA